MAWAFCWVVDSHVDSNAGNGKSGLDSFLTIKGWRGCGGRRSVNGHNLTVTTGRSGAICCDHRMLPCRLLRHPPVGLQGETMTVIAETPRGQRCRQGGFKLEARHRR